MIYTYIMGSNLILTEYLKKKETTTSHQTHVSFNSKKYFIDTKELDVFFKLYSNYIKDDNPPLSIVERPLKLSGFVIDLDFRFDRNYEVHMYSQNEIKDFITACLCEIEEYFDIDDKDKIAFVYEIPKPVIEVNKTGTTYKDGIHIIFPYVVSLVNIQHIIRNNLLENFHDIFEKDKIMYTNIPDKIYDKNILSPSGSGLVMYGSAKLNRIPYKLTKIYKKMTNDYVIVGKDKDITLEEIDVDNYSLLDIISLSSIRNKDKESKININKNDEIEKYNINNDKKKSTNNKKSVTHDKKKFSEPTQLRKLLEILSPTRFDDYSSWVEIGFALFNIGSGDETYLELWDEFSKQSNSWDNCACKKKWNSFNNRNDKDILGIGSIFYWARLDDPIEYIKIISREKTMQAKIRKCLEEAYDYDISCVVNSIYENEFCYENLNQEW